MPVLPPIFPRAFVTPLAALLRAGPAAEETFERPSEAFDWMFEAVCDALAAVCFAASAALDVVDSNRRAARPVNLVDCRTTARDIGNDMVKSMHARRPEREWFSMLGEVVGKQLVVVMKSCERLLQFSPATGKTCEEPR